MNIDPQFAVILDAGHGGQDPETGHYYTAPRKQFDHGRGEFHRKSIFQEGVFNRIITNELAKVLQFNRGIRVFYLHHEYLDLSLELRVAKAWEIYNQFPKAIGISNHANASLDHNASGWEVFTSPGTTKSDYLAELMYEEAVEQIGNELPIRTDPWSDGDADKEARFQILMQTPNPFVLVENAFFDHLRDAQLLMDPKFRARLVGVQQRAIWNYMITNKLVDHSPAA